MASHNELGRWGEDLAAFYLEQKRYIILERDWKSGHRDIDIIAVDTTTQDLVFVEVKTRSNRQFGEPTDAIDDEKIRNLRLAANHYIKSCRFNNDIRFDIVTIVGSMNSEPEIDHIVNAF